MASRAGVASELSWLQKTFATRSSTRPVRSKATRVFSTVGGSAVLVIAATSSRCSAMPARKAGR